MKLIFIVYVSFFIGFVEISRCKPIEGLLSDIFATEEISCHEEQNSTKALKPTFSSQDSCRCFKFQFPLFINNLMYGSDITFIFKQVFELIFLEPLFYFFQLTFKLLDPPIH